MDSLRKQFFFLLKDAGLVDENTENCIKWSRDEHLIRAVICAGLFPGICSVVVSQLNSLFILILYLIKMSSVLILFISLFVSGASCS